jgi:cytidylate kinase
MSGVSGEPYFGRGIENLPPETYAELASGPSGAGQVDDEAFIQATTTVVKDLYRQGDVVIIGRGANILLADTPGVMHVGLMAPLEVRLQTLMQRENLDRDDAEVYVEELERAREAYFMKFFKVTPNEPTLYDLMLNMDKMQPRVAAEVIVHTVGTMRL